MACVEPVQQSTGKPVSESSFRVLIIDDNKAIHNDFRKILNPDAGDAALQSLEDEIFGEDENAGDSMINDRTITFQLDSAHQGKEGYELAKQALANGQPYAMAFVDMRMPPGWDGIETIKHIWADDPNLQIVICTAYSDHTWQDIHKQLGKSDRLLILKKPFDSVEILQLAHALSKKWLLDRQLHQQVDDLDALVKQRTIELENTNEKLRAEMEERDRMEMELRLAQKLEAVGQLASGIAHEINTPIQFVGDSIHFLESAFSDLSGLIGVYQNAVNNIAGSEADSKLLSEIKNKEEEADLEYLQENVPKSIERTVSGVDRVAEIVRAMKEFAHPDSREKTSADINQAISNTLTVAKNEYKYVAEIDLQLSDLPHVSCHIGDINQVILNLVVNAAHAIEDTVKDQEKKGVIGIKTHAEDDSVVIKISDTGSGIPDDVKNRVFDPFFTTKEVGKGTGQGLAIARSIIVDKHQGKLELESEVGKGTCFTIKLPVNEIAGEGVGA
ncbi:MAG: ATP-binding protein [Gammaproteobacteria bacterium]|nr:ATP-binding protein [Gammaproteobacteria bacterium]